MRDKKGGLMNKDYGKPNHFKQWRKHLNLTLREAATALGLSSIGELSDIEHTRNPAPTELIIKMIKLYRVKILSIKQPWASLIAEGYKTIELRSWTRDYRGPLLIHASQKFDKLSYLTLRDLFPKIPFDDFEYPQGKIIAKCNLTDIMELWNPVYAEMESKHLCPISHFGHVGHGLVLEDVKKLPEPIPVNGQLGLWEWKG
jgi:transcriptional regulator with XRE-family HTH domain